ncbi:MAG: polyphenol oxidase family protein [Coriobacteriales bacterium]|jgi:YfiH family protein|nr:polyphenol oxidase family protein [Coriobacteriales bacterium]
MSEPAISKDVECSLRLERFSQLERFPHVAPQSFSLPWLIAFTTLARREEESSETFDFAAGKGEKCRRELEAAIAPLDVTWLSLEHGAKIVTLNSDNVRGADATRDAGAIRGNAGDAGGASASSSPNADAAIITQPGTAAAFTTADCLPLVCVDTQNRVVAAIHAGWRGLAAGIIEQTLERLKKECATSPEQLKVWLGPAIARDDYEVGAEVRDALLARPGITEACFLPSPCDPARFLADVPGAATALLTSHGVPAQNIERCPFSTRQNPLLHSFRRDGLQSGRMATLVGIAV